MVWRRIMFSPAGLSGTSPNALERLGRIARALGAAIEVFDSPYDPEAASYESRERLLSAIIQGRVEQRRRELEVYADALRSPALEVIVSVHWDYPVYEAIVRQVLRSAPDLLVVPTRCYSIADQRLLSYTDHRLIETCPCPLLLLKTREAQAHGTVLAALDPGHFHDRTAGLDDRILAAAHTIARGLGGVPVHVCHWVRPQIEAPTHAEQRTEQLARLDVMAQRVRALAALHGVPAQQVHVKFGAVENELPPFARELRAQIIVMGALSRSLAHRPQLAQTAERVLDALGCDVLVIKPADFQTPVHA